MMLLTQTLRYPKFTGAIAPSSKGLANLITDKSDLSNAKVIVEVGPGTGVFTHEIFKKMDPGSKYFGIEINNNFVLSLNRSMPEAKIYNDSAENIADILSQNGLSKCSRIISGLPWTVFSEQLQEKLILEFIEVLEDGGLFTTFSYYPLNHLPNGKSFKGKLTKHFKQVYKSEVVRNVPPAFVYVCKK